MKKHLIATGLISLFFGFLLQACDNGTKAVKTGSVEQKGIEKKASKNFKSALRPGEKIVLHKIYEDTVKFVDFNSDYDYWYLTVEKNKDTFSLIYNEDPGFIRGEEIAIRWKMDSIWIAGDGERLEFSEWLISARKLKPLKLTNRKIKFLWRETHYDKELKTDINGIVLNEQFIKNISEPEKAALAYAATFIGNECEWDGEPDEDRRNLKCKILWALDLGYQCSNDHLDFLRFWFRNNKAILKEFENCPTTPDGATIQDTFDEINLEVKGNRITVFFKASGINTREGISFTWTEKHQFEFKENELILLKKEVSPREYGTFEMRGN